MTEEALKWCLQLAEGLAYLHAQRPVIVHRDLKLENCLLTGADLDSRGSRLLLTDGALNQGVKEVQLGLVCLRFDVGDMTHNMVHRCQEPVQHAHDTTGRPVLEPSDRPG